MQADFQWRKVELTKKTRTQLLLFCMHTHGTSSSPIIFSSGTLGRYFSLPHIPNCISGRSICDHPSIVVAARNSKFEGNIGERFLFRKIPPFNFRCGGKTLVQMQSEIGRKYT